MPRRKASPDLSGRTELSCRMGACWAATNGRSHRCAVVAPAPPRRALISSKITRLYTFLGDAPPPPFQKASSMPRTSRHAPRTELALANASQPGTWGNRRAMRRMNTHIPHHAMTASPPSNTDLPNARAARTALGDAMHSDTDICKPSDDRIVAKTSLVMHGSL